MSSIVDITSDSQWEQLLNALPDTTLLIASFHAPWAAPCAQMRKALDILALDYPVTDPQSTSWVSVNAEELSDISELYNVTAVPFLVLLRNRKIIDTVSGSDMIKVRNAIETHDVKRASADAGSAQSQLPPSGEPTKNNTDLKDSEEQKKILFRRLDELVKAAPVMLFLKGTPSSTQCGFSRQMVSLLRERSIKYGFFNILADDEVRQGLKQFADWPTYPQLWVDGELVGGLDIAKEEFATDPKFLERYSLNGPPTDATT